MGNLIQEYFDNAAENWDSRCGHGCCNKPQKILSELSIAEGLRILDVACGTGVMIEPLLATKPSVLRGIDLSEKMIAAAREKYGENSVLSLSAADFYTFDEAEFDLIMIYNAYPHFLDKELFFRSLARCLKRGGRFAIAHGGGRDRINEHHDRPHTRDISMPLLDCASEAKRFGNAFHCDIMIDTEDLYLLSGVLV